ncbi:MAG: reverse transcriptase family protein, partial [Pseudomonadota bacterium]|nr:reverse transcriptase family protein [Pseudomonadota bacterium]
VKVLEILVRDFVLSFALSNGLISGSQFGFLPRRSVEAQLLCYLEYCTYWIDKGYSVDTFYCDLSKAFDRVPHSLLLSKLQSKGIGGNVLRFIHAWLHDRVQSVKYNGCISEPTPVASGVPQGSVLGPLLFVLFINDIFDVISNSKCLFYADDGKIFHVIRSHDDKVALHHDIVAVRDWCLSNGMLLSVSKSYIMHLGVRNPLYSYSLDGSIIASPDTVRDLGITIDRKLSFQPHIRSMVHKASVRMNCICRSFSYRGLPFMVLLYKVFVRPLLESCISVWNPHTAQLSGLIESVQKRFIRYAAYSGIAWSDLPCYEARLKVCELEALSDRRLLHDFTLMFKILRRKSFIPADCPLFTFNDRAGRAHSQVLTVQQSTVNLRHDFFSLRQVRSWNALPSDVVQCNTVTKFRSALCHHLGL